MRTVTLLSAAALMVCAGIPAALASSAYTCETFRYGSPTSFTSATGLNNKRQVVGYYTEPGAIHAFLRDPDGTMTPLTSPAGDDNFEPLAINNLGQILGPSFILNPDGTFITIDQPQAPPGHTYFPYQLSGLNDKGEVGGSFARDFTPMGIGTIDFFIREPDGSYRIIDEIPTGGTGPTAFPGALNNTDFLVQQNRIYDGFLIQPDGPKIPLSYPGRPAQSINRALNNNNVTASNFNQSLIAFLRTPDGNYPSIVCPDALNSILFINALNDGNVVVGSVAQGSESVGFIATPTGLVPHILVSNDSWTFGPQLLGKLGGYGRIYISNVGLADFHPQEIRFGQTGQSTDHLQSLGISGTNCPGVPGYSLPGTMAPGDWCYFDFSFTPQAPGWQTAAIYIPSESPESPRVIPIGGTGIGSTLQLSNTSWDFGAHQVGEVTGNGVIYIYNRGPAVITLRLGGPTLTGPDTIDFHLTGGCGTQIMPYTTCALTFNFTPLASGERTAAINLNDNSDYGPILIPVMGYAY